MKLSVCTVVGQGWRLTELFLQQLSHVYVIGPRWNLGVGPVNDVPISIKLMDDSAVSIWVDPSKTDKHFGNTAIYGTQHLICVEKPEYCK